MGVGVWFASEGIESAGSSVSTASPSKELCGGVAGGLKWWAPMVVGGVLPENVDVQSGGVNMSSNANTSSVGIMTIVPEGWIFEGSENLDK